MPLTVTRFAPENVSTADLAKALTDPRPASYKFEYFDISGTAAVSRDMLAYGGAEWEHVPMSWPADEIRSPFRVLPVLHITTASGTTLALSEIFVIDHYLARKFDLLGENAWEEQLIKAYHSSSCYLRERLNTRVTWNYKNVMHRAMELFLAQTLPLWIDTHSKHLRDNGSNGHYVGNKMSLADLQTANNIDHFACLNRGDEIVAMIKACPEIWRVKETVDSEPRLQAWRKSEAYKKHIEVSQAMIPPAESKAISLLNDSDEETISDYGYKETLPAPPARPAPSLTRLALTSIVHQAQTEDEEAD
ncbi:hypothetical protein BGZ99_009950 [Dissophora globulifera]|uniref:glutathione transferase n=1 Tax=Dissophora globulifera TaxID=979702 RepID=A0A9P6UMR6_9FUNG|nr:hypothetical protein BGZ99_009950 [Dissophora globulifera]